LVPPDTEGDLVDAAEGLFGEVAELEILRGKSYLGQDRNHMAFKKGSDGSLSHFMSYQWWGKNAMECSFAFNRGFFRIGCSMHSI